MTRQELIERANTIIANSVSLDYCEFTLKVRDWTNYGKSRTYFSIVEKATDGGSHNKEKDYGYIDNQSGEYFPKKYNDLTENFTFSGSKF